MKKKRNIVYAIIVGSALLGVQAMASTGIESNKAFIYGVSYSNSDIAEELEHDYIPLSTDIKYTDEEIKLIAKMTMAEAESESEYGKRLVIDTILNRVDSAYFPNTVNDVIYQRNQFSCINNGRFNRCFATEGICQLVREEMQSRTKSNVIFFTTGGYSKYGTPLFKVEHHYFSSYK